MQPWPRRGQKVAVGIVFQPFVGAKNANQFTVIVEDNGKGFNPENPEKMGIGIANIKQRVANLGGQVSFDSKPGAGATVIIEVTEETEIKTI
jgi:nitrate/nitrite-specific signal transduction histidine kinase